MLVERPALCILNVSRITMYEESNDDDEAVVAQLVSNPRARLELIVRAKH